MRRDFFWCFEAGFYLPKAYDIACDLPRVGGLNWFDESREVRGELAGRPSEKARWLLNEPWIEMKADGIPVLGDLDLYRVTHVLRLDEVVQVFDRFREKAEPPELSCAETGFEGYIRAVAAGGVGAMMRYRYRVLWASDG